MKTRNNFLPLVFQLIITTWERREGDWIEIVYIYFYIIHNSLLQLYMHPKHSLSLFRSQRYLKKWRPKEEKDETSEELILKEKKLKGAAEKPPYKAAQKQSTFCTLAPFSLFYFFPCLFFCWHILCMYFFSESSRNEIYWSFYGTTFFS